MQPEIMIISLVAMTVILEAHAKLVGTKRLQPGLPTHLCLRPLAGVQVPINTTHQAVAVHRVTRAGMPIAVAARAGAQVGPTRHPGEMGITALTG